MDDESIQKDILAIIERMMLSGWIRESVHSRGFTSSELTAEGRTAARLLRGFLIIRGELSPKEMACFLAVIMTIPPEA